MEQIKQIYIYDIEVFKEDWLFVAKKPHDTEYVIIHNDNHALREFIDQPNILLGGFNNKHYDDGIIHAMYYGADNITVKNMNDFIIRDKRRWWEFPFVQYKKKMFKSFDLRDDLPINLSLKAIEGNMGRAIVESSVPFDIDRKLTDAELKETIEYCKVDVDNTVELYFKRESYLDSKRSVAQLKGIDEYVAMGMTNAKLTARFLDAEKTVRHDEFEYPILDTLDIGKYKEVLDFFNAPVEYTLNALQKKLDKATNKRTQRSLTNQIEKLKESRNIYDCKLEYKIADVKHTFAWGGLHGARTKYLDKSDDKYNIVLIDVASYYPSMMLEYDYISRNIPSSKGYAEVYHKRMNAKATGDKKTSDALKLVLNTTYGAMKNQYNDLYDPRNANAICVGGQLLLTDLVDKLETVKGFKLIQSNTDGIMIKYHRTDEKNVFEIVESWETRTRLNMEYTDVIAIAQKDVNNYVMKTGEVYLVKNGVKNIEKENKGYIDTKGGYVSLYGGGDFRNNSMVVLHDALVKYFMEGIPVEETILNETDVTKFQIIAKTGSTYDATVWQKGDEQIEVNNVNRVYASKDKSLGTVYKLKYNNDNEVYRRDKIASIPEHAIIDNEGKVTIDEIDKDFYIDLAKERIIDYVGKRNANKQLQLNMEEKSKMSKEVKTKTLLQKVNDIRLDFINSGVKKSGINTYAEYKYFTLEDIVPVVLELNKKHNVTTIINFTNELATLTVYDLESDQTLQFTSPMVMGAIPKGATEVQNLGAVQTYMRRYLYMLFLDIVEADAFDLTLDRDDEELDEEKTKVSVKKTHSTRPASPKEREQVKKDIINKDGDATETQIKSIKNGLKKLREKGNNEDYIKEVVLKIRAGIDKKDAESLLLEIAEKVKS